MLLRLILVQSDSELQIFIFDLKKTSDLLMQPDSAKSDRTNSDSRIRWPKSSDFGPKLGQNLTNSANRILKSKNGIRL